MTRLPSAQLPACLPTGWPVDFNAAPAVVAPRLIGVTLLVDDAGGVIVETEAYDGDDPASHCHGGPTARNAAMFGPPGHAYVYRSYGVHWCLNFVCRPAGLGAGVLIRALQPTRGLAPMLARRGTQDERLLCSGPGRLGQALGVTHALNGLALDGPPFALIAPSRPVPARAIARGPRVGITRAAERPWRFGLKDSAFLSRKF